MSVRDFWKEKEKRKPGIIKDKPREVKYNHTVAILMPNSREYISTNAAFSILSMSVPPGLNRMLTTKDVSPIDRCRNEMIKEVFKVPELTHVLMIEPNLKLNPGLLWEIFSINADIVSVPCFDPEPPHGPNIYDKNGESIMDFDRNMSDNKFRSIPIHSCGPGCILIKKEVLENPALFPFRVGPNWENEIEKFTKEASETGFSVRATTKISCETVIQTNISYSHFKYHREAARRTKS